MIIINLEGIMNTIMKQCLCILAILNFSMFTSAGLAADEDYQEPGPQCWHKVPSCTSGNYFDCTRTHDKPYCVITQKNTVTPLVFTFDSRHGAHGMKHWRGETDNWAKKKCRDYIKDIVIPRSPDVEELKKNGWSIASCRCKEHPSYKKREKEMIHCPR